MRHNGFRFTTFVLAFCVALGAATPFVTRANRGGDVQPVISGEVADWPEHTATDVYIWDPVSGPNNADGSYNWNTNNWKYYNGGVYKDHKSVPYFSGSKLAWFPPGCTAKVNLDQPSAAALAAVEIHPDADVTFVGASTNSWFGISTLYGHVKLAAGAHLQKTKPANNSRIDVLAGARLTWPSTAGQTIANCTINVSTGGTYAVAGQLSITNATLTLDAAYTEFTQNGGVVKVIDATVVLDHGTLLAMNGFALGPNGRFEVRNGSTNLVSGTYYPKTGGMLVLSGKSYVQAKNNDFKCGCGFTIDIDDSTFNVTGGAFLTAQGTNDGGGDTIIFRGKNPVLTSAYKLKGNSKALGFIINYEVPEGGYDQAPLRLTHASDKIFDGSGVGKTHVNILPTSAQLAGHNKDILLIMCGPGGVYSSLNIFDFNSASSATNAAAFKFTEFDGLTVTDVAASTREVWVNLGSLPPDVTTESKGVEITFTATLSARVFSLKAAVLQLADAAGYTTRIRVLAGTDAASLAQVDVIDVTARGAVNYSWTAPEWGKRYFVQYVLETLDGDKNVVYSESSALQSGTTVDAATYTWKADENGNWDGAWSATNHWSSDKMDCVGYPNGASVKAYFPANAKATVTLDGAYTADGGFFTYNGGGTGQDITFVNASETVSDNTLSYKSFYAAFGNCKVTFDGVSVRHQDYCDLAKNTTITLKNGSTYTTQNNYHSNVSNTWIKVLSGSTFTVGGEFLVGAGGDYEGGLILSNGTFVCTQLKAGRLADGNLGYGKIRFLGETPLLRINSCFTTDRAGTVNRFQFEIPKTGYATAPIQYSTTPATALFNGTSAKAQTNSFGVLQSSPILQGGVMSRRVDLISWPAGFATDRIEFRNTSKATFFIEGTTLGVRIASKGMLIYVR